METKRFLDLVLEDDGHYCVFAARDGTVKQKFYTSVEDVISAATDFDANGYDAYFALATLEEAGSRKADNVRSLKSFFLDLDCGPDKEFVDQKTAITELKHFCKSNNLPTPTLINSGRGVHVYWILSEAVTRDDWWPVAERLKQLCDTDGFKRVCYVYRLRIITRVTPLPLLRFLVWKLSVPWTLIRLRN